MVFGIGQQHLRPELTTDGYAQAKTEPTALTTELDLDYTSSSITLAM